MNVPSGNTDAFWRRETYRRSLKTDPKEALRASFLKVNQEVRRSLSLEDDSRTWSYATVLHFIIATRIICNRARYVETICFGFELEQAKTFQISARIELASVHKKRRRQTWTRKERRPPPRPTEEGPAEMNKE